LKRERKRRWLGERKGEDNKRGNGAGGKKHRSKRQEGKKQEAGGRRQEAGGQRSEARPVMAI